jgi:hypothetical protein
MQITAKIDYNTIIKTQLIESRAISPEIIELSPLKSLRIKEDVEGCNF